MPILPRSSMSSMHIIHATHPRTILSKSLGTLKNSLDSLQDPQLYSGTKKVGLSAQIYYAWITGMANVRD